MSVFTTSRLFNDPLNNDMDRASSEATVSGEATQVGSVFGNYDTDLHQPIYKDFLERCLEKRYKISA